MVMSLAHTCIKNSELKPISWKPTIQSQRMESMAVFAVDLTKKGNIFMNVSVKRKFITFATYKNFD